MHIPALTTALTSALLLLPTGVSALGINCRGSSRCGGGDVAQKLLSFINTDQCERMYNAGQHIACDGNICAFLQGTHSPTSGASIRLMAKAIVDHGCKACGSVPVVFPELLGNTNDPGAGILTFNFVSNTDNPCPTGLC